MDESLPVTSTPECDLHPDTSILDESSRKACGPAEGQCRLASSSKAADDADELSVIILLSSLWGSTVSY